jgi:hypothetical protein
MRPLEMLSATFHEETGAPRNLPRSTQDSKNDQGATKIIARSNLTISIAATNETSLVSFAEDRR